MIRDLLPFSHKSRKLANVCSFSNFTPPYATRLFPPPVQTCRREQFGSQKMNGGSTCYSIQCALYCHTLRARCNGLGYVSSEGMYFQVCCHRSEKIQNTKGVKGAITNFQVYDQFPIPKACTAINCITNRTGCNLILDWASMNAHF